MTKYTLIIFTSALLVTTGVNADKIKGTRPVPFPSHKVATGTCPPTTAQFDLDINNVRARILNGGDMWWDNISQTNYYEVPIGSNKNSLYTGAIWIGGYDGTGALKVAGPSARFAL